LVALGILCGEFRDVWERGLYQAREEAKHARARLDEFSRSYHLLRGSHDRLEQRLAGSALSLREMLGALRDRVLAPAGGGGEGLAGLAQPLLDVFMGQCGVQAACVYEVDEAGAVGGAPVARLGTVPPPASDDPMLLEALRRGQSVSVRDRGESNVVRSTLLAAIPLVDVQGRCWGVVAIQEMGFSSFQADNLRLLAVLGGHVGDLLAMRLRGESDSAGERFTSQLRRALQSLREHQVPAAAVALHLGHGRGQQLLEPLRAQRRGLDSQWLHTGPRGEPVLLVLLPLSDQRAVEGFVARVERLARGLLNGGLDELGISIRSRVLDQNDRAEDVLLSLRAGGPRHEVNRLDRRGDPLGVPELGGNA
ncbi:MAG TPA: PelD GGDEF domain-containing protein, partial [Longimicrobium sp.]|nr:PelD GGDEF domain-containing protein [Longimicrobium sp.]